MFVCHRWNGTLGMHQLCTSVCGSRLGTMLGLSWAPGVCGCRRRESSVGLSALPPPSGQGCHSLQEQWSGEATEQPLQEFGHWHE